MIKEAQISGFRGVGSDLELTGLKPLTVFFGPNGAGKTAVLEALHAAGSRAPAHALSLAAQERRHPEAGRWLVYRTAPHATISLTDVETSRRELKIVRQNEHGRLVLSVTSVMHGVMHGEAGGEVSFQGGAPPNQMVQPGITPSLHVTFLRPSRAGLRDPAHSFTRVVESGRRREIESVLQAILPGAVDLSILVSSTNDPVLNVAFKDRAIPLASVGDGVSSLISQVLEILATDARTVLLEEPETFKHPTAIDLTAKALWAAVRTGKQIMLSTHSPRLLRSLAREAGEELDLLTGFRLTNNAGDVQAEQRDGGYFHDAGGMITEDLA